MIRVAFVNHSSYVGEDQFRSTVYAIRLQVQREFAPHWGLNAQLYVPMDDHPRNSRSWQIAIVDDQAQADRLGLREDASTPVAVVPAGELSDAGLYWTVAASHVALETLSDPLVNQGVQTADGWYGLDVCDPVADDFYSYRIGRIRVSNFVLPSWYVEGSTGPWDWKKALSGPLEVPEGCYASKWDPSSGWGQIGAEKAPRAALSQRHLVRAREGA